MFNLKKRPRRLRQNKILREMIRETSLEPRNLIYPLFIKEDLSQKKPIESMPGIFQLGISDALNEVKECLNVGVKSFILFGIPKEKDLKASQAYSDKGIIQQALIKIKSAYPDSFLITDVCLCEYMNHGHCGILDSNGDVLNDPTLNLLSQTALSHVKAGADMVAPSDMMDGRVYAIRKNLDENGFHKIPIMSYAVKYASSYYGPFRDAAENSPKQGDRKSYQMDFSNSKEALKEARLDIEEGADILMVKPALPYLDILKELSLNFETPLAAYQVSGEFSQIMAAGKNGWIDSEKVALESLMSLKRAGAQLIVTYFAKEIASKL